MASEDAPRIGGSPARPPRPANAGRLTVYGRATSSNVQALLWGMAELGLDYERIDKGEIHGGLEAESFRAMNPHGRIPVLVADGTALFETAAILRYLASLYGSERFWPSDPLARAQVDMWADWAKNDVAARFTGPVFWQAVRVPPARRDPARIAANLARLEAELSKADARVQSQPWLCGADFTLADVMLGHVLHRYFDIDIARPDWPGLKPYAERLAERPAYRQAVMVDYEILKDTK